MDLKWDALNPQTVLVGRVAWPLWKIICQFLSFLWFVINNYLVYILNKESLLKVDFSWWGGDHKGPPLAEELLASERCWRMESSFPQNLAPGWPVDGPVKHCILAALGGLSEFRKSTCIWKEEVAQEEVEGEGLGVDLIKICYIHAIFQTIFKLLLVT